MRRGLQFALAGFFATLSVTLHGQTAPAVTTMASPPLRFEEKPARTVPRVFEENRGQADDHVRYLSRGQGYSLLLAAHAATLALAATPSDPYRSIRMTFAGAGPVGRIDGVDELAGKVFYAGAKAGLDTGAIKTFRRVRYSSPYPGIDADYHVSDRQIEFDFVVAAKANPHDIALAFSGIDRVQVDAAGELVLEAGPRRIRLKQPLAYQERDGVRTFVDASYLVSPREANTIRFALGSYDSAQPLVIDPVFIIGSLDDDFLAGLEVNAAGEAFLLGNTSACALTKLDAAGVNAVYSILFPDTSQCGTLALSPGGTAYFTGYEAPVTPGLRVATVVRVDDSSGSPVITRIAANNYDQVSSAVSALAADIDDNVYLLGGCRIVEAGRLPLVLNGFNTQPDAGRSDLQPVCAERPLGAFPIVEQVLTKIGPAGNVLYATYLTPDDGDWGGMGVYGLAVDDQGHAFVSGPQTTTLQPTVDAYQPDCSTLGAWLCSYLMMIDTTTTGPASLRYASYLWDGSNLNRQILRRGPGGSVFVASDAQTTTFPETAPRYPYPPFLQYTSFPGDPRTGPKVARFNLDFFGVPNQLAYGFVFGGFAILSDLRITPSGGAAVAGLSYDVSNPVGQWRGSLYVFYPSASMIWSTRYDPIPSNTRDEMPNYLIATSGTDIVYATNTLRAPPPAAATWDLITDRLSNQDSGVNTPPVIASSGNVVVQSADPAGTYASYYIAGYDAEEGQLTPTCDHPSYGFYPVGVTQVTCSVTDFEGLQAFGALQVIVVWNATTVAPGTSVVVRPRDSFYGTPVTLTFHNVQPPGGHVALDMNGGFSRALPAGVRPITLFVYNLTNTAVFDTVDVCIEGTYNSRQFVNLGLYELVNGVWSDQSGTLTILHQWGPQAAELRLCTTVSALGAFAIVEPDDPDEVVVTVAGSSTTAYNGDGIPATTAGLWDPTAAVGDAWGDLYITDRVHQRIRKVSNGIITTVVGGGTTTADGVPGTATVVGGASSLVVDRQGGLLFLDAGLCRIRRLDPQGMVTTVAGTVCFLPESPDGTPGISAVLGQLSSVSGLAMDSLGNLVYSQGYRIRRIAAGPDGLVTGNDPAELLTTVAGLGGTAGYTGDGGRAVDATLAAAWRMAFDRFNNLFIADKNNYVVRRIDAGADHVVTGPPVPDDHSADDETIRTVVGLGFYNSPNSCTTSGDDGPGSLAHMCFAQSLAFDLNGDMLIGENFLRRVKANANGEIVGGPDEIISRVASTSGFTPNGDGSPLSVNLLANNLSVDPIGNIYLIDSIHNLVRRYRPAHAGPARPIVDIADVSVTEGQSGTTPMAFTVTATGAMPYPVSVDFATVDDTAASPSDYTATSGRLTLTSSARNAAITVSARGDLIFESDESLFVRLSNPAGGAVLGRAQATGTIRNDEFDNSPPVAGGFTSMIRHDTPTPLFPVGASSDPNGDPLTVRILVPPDHGTLAVQADQTVLYTPAMHYIGPDQFQYVVNDGVFDSDPALVTLSVENRGPSATSFTAFVRHDSLTTVFPLGVSADADNDLLTVAITVAPTHGVAVVQANQSVLYTPAANYAGADQFEFSVSDGVAQAVATVAIDVRNAVPVAQPSISSTRHDAPVTIYPLGSVRDADQDRLTLRIVVPPAHGLLDVQPDQRVIYTPFAHFVGLDEFQFAGNDGVVDSNVATFTIRVDNAAPIATAFSTITDQDQPRTVQLQGFDGDGDTLSFAIATGPAHGTLGPIIGRLLTYTPVAGYFGNDGFSYVVNDGVVDSPPAAVAITVQPPVQPLSVVVSSPNGGERVFINTPALITWNYQGAITSFDVELSRNNGGTYSPLAGCTNLTVTFGCSFIPTGPATNSARIRVTAHDAIGGIATDVSDAVFAIATGTPAISVTTPNTAVNWAEGSTQVIRWTHNLGIQSFVRIEVSRNGGLSFSPIVAQVKNTAAGSGTYTWVVSGPTTMAAMIRVVSVDDTVADISNVTFAIVSPMVTVTTPNTAVQWRAGSAQTIRFTHSVGVGEPFDIDLSRDGGVTWSLIGSTTSTSATAGVLPWTVAGPPTTQARVRVRWTAAPGATDMSDTDFRVLPRVTVTAPNTAVTWGAGSTRTVSWTHNLPAGQLMDIDFSADNGATWMRLAMTVPNSGTTTGSYAIVVPALPTTQGLIRVRPSISPGDGDVSDVPFTVEASRVSVTSPNTAVNWVIGSTHTITWSHNLGAQSSYTIEVSRDNGVTYSLVTANAISIGATNGSYQWFVAGPVSPAAQIRVRWNGSTTWIFDVGDVPFRIGSAVTVTSPNSAVTWAAGSTRTISWNHSLGAGQLMDIDFTPNGGANWTSLAIGVPSQTVNSGSYAVRLPASPTTLGLIRVSPSGRPADGDVSNTTFTLAAPAIAIVSPNTNVQWAIGTQHTISWTHNLGNQETARIEVSGDGGATWTAVAPAVAMNNTSGTFAWSVAGPATTAARIRATWTANPAVGDASDVNFRIQ